MSSRARLGPVALSLLLGLAIPVPTTASAQQTEEELIRKIERLTPLVDRAYEIARQASEARSAAARAEDSSPADTFGVGPFRVIALRQQIDLVRDLFEETLAERFPGLAEASEFPRAAFFVQWQTRLDRLHTTSGTHRVVASTLVTREGVKDRIAEAVQHAVSIELDRVDAEVGDWGLRGPVREGDLSEVYRQLATRASQSGRRCLESDPMACWLSLGLDVGPRALEEWYTPEERQALAGQIPWRRSNTDQRVACIERGDIAACDAYLRVYEWRRFEPAGEWARANMLWLALEQGGPEAWARILEDPTMDPGEALRYASGLTTLELATLWRDRVIAARPDVHAGFGLVQFATLFWTLVFAGLATRSTRWRLG